MLRILWFLPWHHNLCKKGVRSCGTGISVVFGTLFYIQMLRNRTHWVFLTCCNLVISLFHMWAEVIKLISNMFLIGVFLSSLRTPVRRQLDRHTGRDSTSFMTEDHLYRKHLKCNFFFFNPIIFRFYLFPFGVFFFSFFFPCTFPSEEV